MICFAFLPVVLLALLTAVPGYASTDIEANAFPEFYIWIALDKERKNRIYILNSYANEPKFVYDETAIGISWDQRFHPNWSWRAGIRYIDKQVDPPNKNETRAVLDLKWFKPLGNDWLFTDRNRIDLRWFEGDDGMSFRYRNRMQIEKPFPVFSWMITGFGSYEPYYDSRYDKLIRRHRFVGGVSIPIVKWLALGVFYDYYIETAPKKETGGAIGIAIGIYFY